MGQLAILADIHANFQALDAVLNNVTLQLGTDKKLIILGDIVSLGPNPNECITRLRNETDVSFVSGNNDRYVVEQLYDREEKFHEDIFDKIPEGYRNNLRWTRENLPEDSITFIRTWPPCREMDIAGKKLLAVHASKDNDENVIPLIASGKNSMKEWQGYDVYMFGHTHQAFMETVDGTIFLNPGSVGYPIDGDIRASYAILDLNKDPIKAEIIRVPYDLEETILQMVSLRIPWAHELIPTMRRASFGA